MRKAVIETPCGKWEISGIEENTVFLALRTKHIEIVTDPNTLSRLRVPMMQHLRFRLVPFKFKWYHRIDSKGYIERPFPFGVCLGDWVRAQRLIHTIERDMTYFCDPLMKEDTEVSIKVKPIKQMFSLLP